MPFVLIAVGTLMLVDLRLAAAVLLVAGLFQILTAR